MDEKNETLKKLVRDAMKKYNISYGKLAIKLHLSRETVKGWFKPGRNHCIPLYVYHDLDKIFQIGLVDTLKYDTIASYEEIENCNNIMSTMYNKAISSIDEILPSYEIYEIEAKYEDKVNVNELKKIDEEIFNLLKNSDYNIEKLICLFQMSESKLLNLYNESHIFEIYMNYISFHICFLLSIKLRPIIEKSQSANTKNISLSLEDRDEYFSKTFSFDEIFKNIKESNFKKSYDYAIYIEYLCYFLSLSKNSFFTTPGKLMFYSIVSLIKLASENNEYAQKFIEIVSENVDMNYFKSYFCI